MKIYKKSTLLSPLILYPSTCIQYWWEDKQSVGSLGKKSNWLRNSSRFRLRNVDLMWKLSSRSAVGKHEISFWLIRRVERRRREETKERKVQKRRLRTSWSWFFVLWTMIGTGEAKHTRAMSTFWSLILIGKHTNALAFRIRTESVTDLTSLTRLFSLFSLHDATITGKDTSEDY